MSEARHNTQSSKSQTTVVEAKNIEKAYGSWLPFSRSVEVLDGATLEIGSGEIVGIMGENGSGKSTLMQVLAGVLGYDRGTVTRSGRIGWCPQEPRLYDRLTVDETFDLFGEAYDMSNSDVEGARSWLLEELDFERFRDRQVRNLSGGNKQKLNLSVALMHEPDLLLLDEPYTGFDWKTFQAFSGTSLKISETAASVSPSSLTSSTNVTAST
ncbi:ATP-binding cassette domain-containing protein [Halorhabdus rudnickae]|uniref:ATP-binding cassette domain-containing protein n=1 Tax=Halorhabdus rudnickae TaxID=1775544 RepID=UPI001FCE39C8|nr:ABC transporter ATP-binding protein [Halorhabdus rudnickae]